MTNEQIQSLCEAVADIAYIAGHDKYYGGDSREDTANFIEWAKEFERIHEGEEWIDKDYIDEITKFAHEKMGTN